MSLARALQEFRPLFRMLEGPISRSAAYNPNIIGSSLLDDPIFSSNTVSHRPAVDVSDEGKKYVLEADLPGVKKDDIEVRIGDEGHSVTIEGKIQEKREDLGEKTSDSKDVATAEKPDNKISRERFYARNAVFSRTVWLPRPVDINQVSAKLDHGVLTISVDKADDKGTTVVPVQ